jgi:hypothetical protein
MFYIGLFFLWLPAALIAASAHAAYLSLITLSYVATFSFFGLVLYLGWDHEFETLQSYGVSFKRVALPAFTVTLVLQAGISAFTFIASDDVPRAMTFAIWSFLAVAACAWITLKTIWDQREAAAFRACVRGFAAQTAVLLLWGTASFLYLRYFAS